VEEPRERDPLADDPLREFFVWWDTIFRSDTDQLERLLDDERLRRELGARARCRVEERFSLQVVGGQLPQCLISTSAFHATR
jgi:glycosyltransferase involved in cell wall biosynthesis